MSNKPYKYWTRDEMFNHLCRQCKDYSLNYLIVKIKEDVYDERWNPMEEYNGCNLIEDKYHPDLSCFFHDADWSLGRGGLNSDVRFLYNLLSLKTSVIKSIIMFTSVRLGWIFWHKKRFK